jgi:hypothetical protein
MTAPKELSDVGFETNWDLDKISKLDLPINWTDIDQLSWHFDLPLLSENNGNYNLKPKDLIEHPGEHQVEYYKTIQTDVIHPINVYEYNDRLVIIDGIYRLIKAVINGEKKVAVRIIPPDKIQELKK